MNFMLFMISSPINQVLKVAVGDLSEAPNRPTGIVIAFLKSCVVTCETTWKVENVARTPIAEYRSSGVPFKRTFPQ